MLLVMILPVLALFDPPSKSAAKVQPYHTNVQDAPIRFLPICKRTERDTTTTTIALLGLLSCAKLANSYIEAAFIVVESLAVSSFAATHSRYALVRERSEPICQSRLPLPLYVLSSTVY